MESHIYADIQLCTYRICIQYYLVYHVQDILVNMHVFFDMKMMPFFSVFQTVFVEGLVSCYCMTLLHILVVLMEFHNISKVV